MNRTWLQTAAGVAFCFTLSAGSLLAQGAATKPGPTGAAPTTGAAGQNQPAPPTYNPVTAETLGQDVSAARLVGSYVKLSDVFGGWVANFPDDALRAGLTPRDFAAFRTQRAGSNLLCFIPLNVAGTPNADLKALQDANPVRGTEIYLKGRVGTRVLAADSVATMFQVDRVTLGHDEPKAPKDVKKEPVLLTIEKTGPDGKVHTKEWKFETPGQPYWIPDPSDPNNKDKYMKITLKF